MSGGWRSYRGAPEPGTRLCTLDDLAVGRALCLDVAGFPLVLLRLGADSVRAYVNACPHQYLPLDHRADRVLSADGRALLCTNHGAAFAVETGLGVAGPGLGACLDPVPVTLADGTVRIADEA